MSWSIICGGGSSFLMATVTSSHSIVRRRWSPASCQHRAWRNGSRFPCQKDQWRCGEGDVEGMPPMTPPAIHLVQLGELQLVLARELYRPAFLANDFAD